MKEGYAGGTRGASAPVLCKFRRLWKATNFGARKLPAIPNERIAKPRAG